MENNTMIVSEKDCEILFKNYLKSSKFTITAIEIKSLADIVTGMMAEYYNLTITAKDEHNKMITKNFFVKKLVMFHKIQEIMNKNQGAFEKEEYFYKFLMEECKLIPDFKIDFAPECYHMVKDDIIVLENLIDYEYSLPKLECDLQQLKLALKALAEFHACSIVYEEVQSKLRRYNYNLYEENSDVFKDSLYRLDENYLGRHWFKNCLNTITCLIDVLPKLPLPKNEIKDKLHKYSNKMYEIITPSTKFKNVCCHGDLSNVNVLYKYEHNHAVGCKIVDYQALRYNPPAHDVINFIYLNTISSFRRDHLNDLLTYYYKCLETQLLWSDLYLDKFISRSEFDESCEYVLPFAILQTAFYNTMRMVVHYFPEKKYNQEEYKRFVYDDRSPECLKVYQMDSTFREDINDLILELCNL